MIIYVLSGHGKKKNRDTEIRQHNINISLGFMREVQECLGSLEPKRGIWKFHGVTENHYIWKTIIIYHIFICQHILSVITNLLSIMCSV